jgi:hypothetical protein
MAAPQQGATMTNPTSPNLPAIDGPELARLARTGVLAEAETIRRDVSKALGALNTAAIVALAMAGAPGESAAVAVHALKSKVADMLRVLQASSEELQAAQRAEHARIAPLVAAAAHRSLEVVGILEFIAGRIRSGESNQNGKRDRLKAAGLIGADLDRAAAPFDPSELQVERAALMIEQDALQQFIQTRDPDHLPASFTAEAV